MPAHPFTQSHRNHAANAHRHRNSSAVPSHRRWYATPIHSHRSRSLRPTSLPSPTASRRRQPHSNHARQFASYAQSRSRAPTSRLNRSTRAAPPPPRNAAACEYHQQSQMQRASTPSRDGGLRDRSSSSGRCCRKDHRARRSSRRPSLITPSPSLTPPSDLTVASYSASTRRCAGTPSGA